MTTFVLKKYGIGGKIIYDDNDAIIGIEPYEPQLLDYTLVAITKRIIRIFATGCDLFLRLFDVYG